MDGARFAAAMRLSDTVRWYEWVGLTACGKKVRAQSRSMVHSALNERHVKQIKVQPPEKKDR